MSNAQWTSALPLPMLWVSLCLVLQAFAVDWVYKLVFILEGNLYEPQLGFWWVFFSLSVTGMSKS